tara:strand:- start:442 stop:1719 length:1278 start_codon:yes stop_codon:yes gene_type:complete
MSNKQEIQKVIDTKQKFSHYAYKEYTADKFGMTPCCTSQYDNYTLQNDICTWEGDKKTIYDVDTYTFDTWNFNTYTSNTSAGGTFPSWVQTINSTLSYRIRWGIKYEDATAASVPATDMDIILTNAILNSMEGNDTITRGQSRAFVLTPRYCNLRETAAGVLDPCYAAQMNLEPPAHSMSASGNLERQTLGKNWEWQRIEWLCINPGGTLLPASPNPATLVCRKNTSPAGMPKNGANTGDFIVILLVKSGSISTDTLADLTTYGDEVDAQLNSSGGTYVDWNDYSSYAFADGVNWTLTDPQTGFGVTVNDWKSFYRSHHFVNADYLSDAKSICSSDKELLYITVVDKNAAPVKDYEIVIDNKYYGKTDAAGIFITSLENASVDTKHMINGCKCFTTTGGCNQQKIDIVLKDVVKPVCTNLTIDCL